MPKNKFFVAAFNHLLAFPNTNTYRRFEEEGRLISPKWWLEKNYTYGTISYNPKLLTTDELRELCREYKTKFFTFKSIFKRWIALLKRNKNIMLHFVFWYMNILLHFEVDKRIGIPVGHNLDEEYK